MGYVGKTREKNPRKPAIPTSSAFHRHFSDKLLAAVFGAVYITNHPSQKQSCQKGQQGQNGRSL